MLQKVSQKLYNKIAYGVKQSDDEKEIICYGIELLLYTVLSTASLVCISLLFDRITSGIIIVLVFYINQTIGGGIHLNTHLGCLLLMSIGLIGGLMLCQISYPFVWFLISLICFVYLYYRPLVLHKNKAYMQYAVDRLARKSRLVVIIEAMVLFIILLCDSSIMVPYSIGVLLTTSSRFIAVKRVKTIDPALFFQ